MSFFEFPHARTYDSDLGWLMSKYPEIAENAAKAAASEEAAKASEEAAAQSIAQAARSAAAAASSATQAANSYSDMVAEVQDVTDTLNARLSQAIAAVTPGDTELTDIRVSYSGYTYTTAGDAVRTVTRTNADSINRLNGDVYSINLFDKSDVTLASERDVHTGEIISSNPGACVSGIIPVKPNSTLYFHAKGSPVSPYFIYVWNADGNYARRENGATSFNVTRNMSAVSICFSVANLDDMMMSYDNINTYEEYGALPRKAYNLATENAEKLEALAGTATDNPLEVIKETPGYTECFPTVGVIGDSLASGLVSARNADFNVTSYLTLKDYAWPAFMARMTGNTYYNFSRGGLNTRTWLASEYATQCFDGLHNAVAYIVALGVNDDNDSIPIGTIADIHDSDYTQNPDTFYGNYGRIIARLKQTSPIVKPKIFIVTAPSDSVENNGYNAAIRAIATHYDNVWLIDLYTYAYGIYHSEPFTFWERNTHYNGMAYLRSAYIMMTYIDWIVRKNPDWFRTTELIDTEYTYYSHENR